MLAGAPDGVEGNEQVKPRRSTAATNLALLLGELEPNTGRIRAELPGWYPYQLLPVLRDVLSAVRSPACRIGELDARAAQLAGVLRQRPETAHIPGVLQHAATSPDKAMRPMSELPETILLPDRVRNECEVLAQKIIQSLEEPNRTERGNRPADATGGAETADRDRRP